jgi:type 1 fimbria pilin
MKKYFAALTTTALIIAAPFALAASSTDLTVTGIITPVACTPSFTGGGDIEIGKISSSDLNQDSNTLIGTDPIQLAVACDAAISFALNPIDNQAGTSMGDWFGLGLTDEGKELGQFVPRVMRITDGTNTLDAIKSTDGNTWEKATDAQPGYLLSFTNASGSLPIDAKNVTFEFEVDTYISRADQLNLKNEVTIDGSATFEVKYL